MAWIIPDAVRIGKSIDGRIERYWYSMFKKKGGTVKIETVSSKCVSVRALLSLLQRSLKLNLIYR